MRLSGVYVLIVHTEEDIFVYTDPAGLSGVYYDLDSVASTPALLEDLEIDETVRREFVITKRDPWMTGSRTPFRGVKALLANHCLTVRGRATRRFWPLSHFEPAMGYEELVAESSRIVASTIAQVASSHNALLSITGGYDSRVNFAAALSTGAAYELFTLRSSAMSRSECQIILRLLELSEAAGRHKYYNIQKTPEWLNDMYDEMTCGASVGARRDVIGGLQDYLNCTVVHINGNLGALAKGFYWDRVPPRDYDYHRALRDFCNQAPAIRSGLHEWSDTLPSSVSSVEAYNLLYLEQRGGRWMGVGEAASQLFYDSYTPFCSRKIFELICQCPPVKIATGAYLGDLVRFMRPELARIPYHSGTSRLRRLAPRGVKTALGRYIKK